ncbi:MAG: MerR family transcriptional regulator [Candidatus Handelsmanbacteria bacterium]|nr:MerR family transcriptional regulator [Candidatus Handelsmanbacteria bacterium]
MKHPLGQKLYFSISEVAELTGLQPYILRTWEKEFACLRPRRLRGKNRAYRQRDINLIVLIKRLLYEERFTIQGVRQKLKNDADLVRHAIEQDGGPVSVTEEAGEESATDPGPLPGDPPDPTPRDNYPLPPSPSLLPAGDPALLAQIRAELQAILRVLA